MKIPLKISLCYASFYRAKLYVMQNYIITIPGSRYSARGWIFGGKHMMQTLDLTHGRYSARRQKMQAEKIRGVMVLCRTNLTTK
jgi:hypothetical protein